MGPFSTRDGPSDYSIGGGGGYSSFKRPKKEFLGFNFDEWFFVVLLPALSVIMVVIAIELIL